MEWPLGFERSLVPLRIKMMTKWKWENSWNMWSLRSRLLVGLIGVDGHSLVRERTNNEVSLVGHTRCKIVSCLVEDYTHYCYVGGKPTWTKEITVRNDNFKIPLSKNWDWSWPVTHFSSSVSLRSQSHLNTLGQLVGYVIIKGWQSFTLRWS